MLSNAFAVSFNPRRPSFLLLCLAPENALLVSCREEARISELEEELRLMKAKLAESDKNLADSKSQLADKDARIAELMQHMTDLTHSLNKNADIPKPPLSDYSEALKLIEQIQGTVSRKVLEVPVDHFTECTAAEGRNASVGLIFEEKGGKIMVVSTLVGSPAYGCQKLQAGDEVRVHVQESELERGRVGSEMHCRPVCEASM